MAYAVRGLDPESFGIPRELRMLGSISFDDVLAIGSALVTILKIVLPILF